MSARRVLALGSAYAALLARLSLSRADEPSGGERGLRAVILEGQTGPNAPLGQMGLALDVELLSWLSISAGYGSNTVAGPLTDQVLIMPRVRQAFARTPGLAVSAGLGVEHGEVDRSGAPPGTRLDAELSVECSAPGGLRARVFVGGGRLLSATPPPGGLSPGATAGYAGVAIGYAFWPNPIVPSERSWSIGRWYGWQSLALDMLGASMYWLPGAYGYDDIQSRRHTADFEASTVYLISGPAVHVAHRRYLRAVASLGLRVAGPAVGFAVGEGSAVGERGDSNAVKGLAVGAAIASIVDAIALGWERASGDGNER